MHSNTKLTPVLRKEVYTKWKTGTYSLRSLAKEYHVDKRVVQRIIERGNEGDFSARKSINHRYLKKASKTQDKENTATTKKRTRTTTSHTKKRSAK